MNELLETEKIEDLIFEIDGKQVMLDSDLARLYQCKNGTKTINQAVKRNIKRFPKDFCFQLSDKDLQSQIGTAMSRSKPFVFTEQGVAMLATVIKTDIAVDISISIMRTFVIMRKYISNEIVEQKYINNMVLKNSEDIKLLQESFSKFENKEINNHIFFEGQIYDAYSLMMNILNKAKKEIIIIDNYAGRELFDLIKGIQMCIKIYTKNIDNEASKKYLKQYNNIEIINTDIFHDRFIVIDKKTLYHCGSSFKDLGKKCFAINLIGDKNMLKQLLNIIKYEE